MEQIKGVHPKRITEMYVAKNMTRREIQNQFPHLTPSDIKKALQQTSNTIPQTL